MRMIDAEITIVMTAALPVTTGPDLSLGLSPTRAGEAVL
jgi:hypothetical protein